MLGRPISNPCSTTHLQRSVARRARGEIAGETRAGRSGRGILDDPTDGPYIRARMSEPGRSGVGGEDHEHVGLRAFERLLPQIEPETRACDRLSVAHRHQEKRESARHVLRRVVAVQQLARVERQHLRRAFRARPVGLLTRGSIATDSCANTGFPSCARMIDRNRPDVLLEHDARLGAGERDLADCREHVRGADGRVTGERYLTTRREDAHAARVLRIFRGKDERRLGVVELARDVRASARW